MNTRLLALFSGMMLLAACETPPVDDGSTDMGAGNSNYGSGINNGSIGAGDQADLEQNVGDRVFFGYDSAKLTGEAQNTLQRQAQWLQEHPHLNVIIEGHCDERGTRAYNLALGERRASSALNYLVSLGVNPSRVTAVSYGKERPAVLGSNDSAWAQNRRSVTVISY